MKMEYKLVLYACLLIVFTTVFINAENCTYNEVEADRTGRRCNRDAAACSDEKKCKGKRRCRCDDICGLVCIPVFRNNFCDIADLGGLTVGLSVSYSDERIRFATTATFSCSPGYKLNDESLSIRKCRGDGRWSSETPTCVTGVACGIPPTVEYARHNGTDANRDERLVYGIEERLKYECDPGYIRQGYPYITCKRDEFNASIANWTAVNPELRCTPVSCGNPGTVFNGRRNGYIFSFGSEVTFECNEGYQLSGRSYRVCQANGEWDGYVPSCNPIRCPSIPDPQNGYLFGSSNTYRSQISINCDTGFVVTGTNSQRVTITCRADKTWSHSPQTCQAVNCGNPGVPMNGTRNGDDFGFQGYILFSCDDGFRLDGSKSIYCQKDNKWSNPIPRCIGQCLLPSLPDNLKPVSNYYSGYKVDEGTEYLISCKEGYTLNSQTNTWRCLASGIMSFNPFCIENPCQSLNIIEHGVIEYNDLESVNGFMPGTIATYYCDEGYAFDDEIVERTCRRGHFTGEEPTCKITICEASNIMNGFAIDYPPVFSVIHGTTINYGCIVGYHLVGSSEVLCWEETLIPTPPICEEDPCPAVSAISNGIIVYDATDDADGLFPPGTTTTYQCFEGYKLSTEGLRTCVKGKFSGSSPECLLTNCEIPSLSNVHIVNNTDEFYHGTTVTFICDDGYESQDKMNVLCWNESLIPNLPHCTEKSCQEIKENSTITYDNIKTNGKYPPGTIAKWKVRTEIDNHRIPITSTICYRNATCELGNFEKKEKCIVTCPRYEVAHADVRYIQNEHDVDTPEILPEVQRNIICNNPYKMNDTELRQSKCKEDGSWTHTTPACVKKCTVIGPPKYGRITSDTIPGSMVDSKTVISKCYKNYFLEGKQQNKCDFSVIVQQPQCVEESAYTDHRYCPLLENKQFGWYSYSDSLHVGSIVRFACTHQYTSSIPAFQRECKEGDSGNYDWFPKIMEEPVCVEPTECQYNIITKIPKDGSMSASSFLEKEPANYGRINGRGSVDWHPSEKDQDQWLQIQYDISKTIYGVVLLSTQNEWVTLYLVKYTSDVRNEQWNVVKNKYGNNATFLGNINKNMAKIQMFPHEIKAIALRIYPLEYYEGISMQIAVIDCQSIESATVAPDISTYMSTMQKGSATVAPDISTYMSTMQKVIDTVTMVTEELEFTVVTEITEELENSKDVGEDVSTLPVVAQ